MTPWKAAVLGLVEGATEYVPVSSTGHLLVASELLGLGTTEEDIAAANTYAIAIQFGAILAVAGLFWKRFREMLLGLVGRSDAGRYLILILGVAFVPGRGRRLPLRGPARGPPVRPVADRRRLVRRRRADPRSGASGQDPAPGPGSRPGHDPVLDISVRQALMVGLAQIVAMWPGVSRSLATILGALLVGVGMVAAVEFSFLLGFLTLTAASIYKVATDGGTLVDQFGIVDPLIGLVFAFAAAVVAIKWMISYLERRSLAVFGWYRIAAAGLTAVLILAGIMDG
jgi:undecaprenyl-diphosphatase